MKNKKVFLILGLIILGGILAIGGLFLLVYLFPDNIEFYFYIEENKENLEGRVYFEDPNNRERIYLGFAEKGYLIYDKQYLYPGNIVLIGEYGGIPFEYSYILTRENLEYGRADYVLLESEISDLKFELKSEEIIEIRKEIFDLINYERDKRGIEKLVRNDILDNIAQEYSERMLKENFYSHTDPQGNNHYDRLQEMNIFYTTATENLAYNPFYSDTNLTEEIVYGWIKSPGHSIPILDTNKPIIWNNLGVGLSCEKIGEDVYYTCYSTALFAGFDIYYINEDLKEDYIQIIKLYPEEFEYSYDTKARIIFNSTSSVRIILTNDKEDFNRLARRNSLKGEIFRKDTNNYDEEIVLKKGYSLLIHSRNKDITYNLSVEYNV
jgi:hypothetical protein